MKRPGYRMSVYVIARVNEDGSINFNEFKDQGKLTSSRKESFT